MISAMRVSLELMDLSFYIVEAVVVGGDVVSDRVLDACDLVVLVRVVLV